MRKFWTVILLAVALSGAADRQSIDPTNYALGARSIGLGGAVVAVGDDVNALRANPAALASNQKLQFGLNSYEFLNTYKFLDLVSIVPTPLGFFGVSYFSYGVNDIPETSAVMEGTELRIYRTGQYSYAENILGLTYAQQGPRELSLLKNIDYGGTFKLAYSTLAGETLSGWGLDAGVRFDLTLPAVPYLGELGDITLGLGIQNLLAPTFVQTPSEEGDEAGTSSGYQMNLRLGAAKPFELFGQSFITAGDFDNNGLHFGLEYIADRSLRLRAGLDDFYPTYGLGYRMFSITGFDGNPYTMSLDYAFRTFPQPFNNVHYISITIRGISKTQTPEIISSFESENLTANSTAVNGTAEPNADVTVYVNERLRKTVKADVGGIWNATNIYLDDGPNNIYAIAKYEQFVESEQSNVVTLYTDQIKPVISTTIARSGDTVLIRVSVNKEVETVLTRLPDGSQITLFEDEESGDWLGSWNIAPEYYNTAITLRTIAIDGFGNRSDVVEDVYSAKFVTAPRDKTITPRKTLYVRGIAKQGTVRVAVGEQSVTPDADGRFNLPIELAQEGKNVVEIAMIDAEGQTVSTAVRVLKIQEADDLSGFSWARNQVASVLSLGAMSNDPNNPASFRPEDFVTRAEFAKALVLLKGLELLPNPVNIAPDVLSTDENAPYIKAALDAGYLELQAEGFLPGAFITRKDAVTAVVRMDGLNGGNLARQVFEDVPPYMPYAPQVAAALEAGIISPQENFYPDRELTRVEAAAMLAASQTAQRRINELYDWKSGYGEQFVETPLSALPVYEQRVLADLYVNGHLISLDETAEENLRILSPLDRSIVDRQLLEVKGLIKGADHVLLNGVTVPAQKGVFLARVNLREGRNIIRVQSGAEPDEGALPETRTVRVLYVKAFSDKPDTLDNLRYNAASAYARFSRFDGGQLITRGEAQLILNGLKGASGGNTVSAEPLSLAAAREMLNEWDGKEAADAAVAAGLPDTAALTREQFITMLANTDFYRGLLEQYRNFDEYESAEDVAAPDGVEDRSELIIQAEELNDAAAKKKITADDYQGFLGRYDRQRLSTSRSITRSGDSIAADGRTRLIVVSPENNFRVNQESLTLRGFSGGVEEVRVNSRAVRAGGDSSFTQVIALDAGKNNIVVDNGAETVRLKGLRLLTYQDIQNVPERGLIEYLATLGFFKEGQDFYPNQELTREEVAALLVRMISATPQQVAQPVFSDVAANRWSAPSIKLLADRGIIKETGDVFRPEDRITQQEAFAWYQALSAGSVNTTAPQGTLARREFARWLFADSRVRGEIDNLNN